MNILNRAEFVQYYRRSTSFRAVMFFIISFIALNTYAQEKLYLLRDSVLHVLDSSDASILYAQDVGDIAPNMLIGTPGGKYVFALNTQTGMGSAIDFESDAVSKALDFSDSAPIDQIVFSPMGDVVYAFSEGADVDAYDHRAGEIQFRERFKLERGSDDNSPLNAATLNSRGTRFYRMDAEGLRYSLVSDRKTLKRIEIEANVPDWTMSPEGRFLWGSGGNALMVVDERSGRKQFIAEMEDIGRPMFGKDGLTAWVLAQNGTVLLEMDVRRTRVRRQLDLPEPAAHAAPRESDSLWLLGRGSIYRINPEGTALPLRTIPGDGMVLDFLSVQLKPNQGFACF